VVGACTSRDFCRYVLHDESNPLNPVPTHLHIIYVMHGTKHQMFLCLMNSTPQPIDSVIPTP
jgi:hypothetical protein